MNLPRTLIATVVAALLYGALARLRRGVRIRVARMQHALDRQAGLHGLDLAEGPSLASIQDDVNRRMIEDAGAWPIAQRWITGMPPPDGLASPSGSVPTHWIEDELWAGVAPAEDDPDRWRSLWEEVRRSWDAAAEADPARAERESRAAWHELTDYLAPTDQAGMRVFFGPSQDLLVTDDGEYEAGLEVPEGCWRTMTDDGYRPCGVEPAGDLGLCDVHLAELQEADR